MVGDVPRDVVEPEVDQPRDRRRRTVAESGTRPVLEDAVEQRLDEDGIGTARHDSEGEFHFRPGALRSADGAAERGTDLILAGAEEDELTARGRRVVADGDDGRQGNRHGGQTGQSQSEEPHECSERVRNGLAGGVAARDDETQAGRALVRSSIGARQVESTQALGSACCRASVVGRGADVSVATRLRLHSISGAPLGRSQAPPLSLRDCCQVTGSPCSLCDAGTPGAPPSPLASLG